MKIARPVPELFVTDLHTECSVMFWVAPAFTWYDCAAEAHSTEAKAARKAQAICDSLASLLTGRLSLPEKVADLLQFLLEREVFRLELSHAFFDAIDARGLLGELG